MHGVNACTNVHSRSVQGVTTVMHAKCMQRPVTAHAVLFYMQLVVISGLVWNFPTSCAWAARVYVNNR